MTTTNNDEMNRPSLSLSCNLCGQPITFDNKHISQRTGKKIPLDVETNEPHDYPVRRDQPQQQGQQQQQGQSRSSQQQAGKNQAQPSSDKMPGTAKPNGTTATSTTAASTVGEKRVEWANEVWGTLPEHVRKRFNNLSDEQFLPEFEQVIRQYYDRLSERGRKDP